jgi:hypothetical protein
VGHHPSLKNTQHLQKTTLLASQVNQANENLVKVKLFASVQPPGIYNSFVLDPTFLGTSLVKYTTPLPCINLSESDSKLHTNFEFCEGKNHKHLKNIDLQSHVDNKFLKEKSSYCRRRCQ